MGLLFGLALIFALFVSYSPAQDTVKISGKVTAAAVERPTVEFDDAEGHMIFVSKWEGVNVSTDEDKFMDGAKVVIVSCGDYVKGNGPFWGYVKMSLNGDVVFSKLKGNTTTTLDQKGRPVTEFEGGMKFVKGTGEYENIQGNGTFKSKMIATTMQKSKWEGEYFIEKK